MKHGKNILALILAAVLLLGGCGSSLANYGTTVAATYGDRTIYLDEANFWLRYAEYSYSYMQQLYAYYYGADLWTSASGRRTQTYAESVKEDVMAQLLQVNILLDHVSEFPDAALTQEDSIKIQGAMGDLKTDAASIFSEDVIGNFSDDSLRASLERHAQAVKVWHAVREQAAVNVAEEDCKSFTLNYFTISSTTSATVGSEDAGATATKTGVDLANFLLDELKLGSSFDTLKGLFSNLSANTTSYRFNDTATTSVLFTDGKEMKTGDVKLIESNGTYYVVQCKSDNDADAAKTARENLESEQKEAHFKEVYAEWKKAAKPFSVKSAYNNLKIGS